MPHGIRAIQVQVMTSLASPGGGATHARGLATALARLGLHVSVLCTGAPATTGDDAIEFLPRRPRRLPLLWRWPPLGTLPAWIPAIRRASGGVDAIVSLSPELAVASRLARPAVPVIYCPAALHGCENPWTRRTWLGWCERRAFRKSSAVLFPARVVQHAAEALYGPLPGLANVCLLGIDEARVATSAATRRALGLPTDAFVILTVGAINRNKGQLEIARALAGAAPSQWYWIVVGDGPDWALVARTLKGSAFAERTLIVGNSERVADWYATADVVVSASRCETFSLSCAEALAAGVPVVLPAHRPGRTLSPLADIVVAQRVGRTFERDRPESLVHVLRELAADPPERQRMGARGRAYAAQNFSWDRYAAGVLDLIAACRAGTDAQRVALREARGEGGVALSAAPRTAPLRSRL